MECDAYSGSSGRVDVHNALDIGSRSIDGRVEHEPSLVHSKVGASSVHNLPLYVDLDLCRGYRDNRMTQQKASDLFILAKCIFSQFLTHGWP